MRLNINKTFFYVVKLWKSNRSVKNVTYEAGKKNRWRGEKEYEDRGK